MRAGQNGVESCASWLMTPPNGCGGAGICFPSITTVAFGAPLGVLTSWAIVVAIRAVVIRVAHVADLPARIPRLLII